MIASARHDRVSHRSTAETPVLRGKKVAVVGLAKSGTAAVTLLRREGAQVTGVDRRSLAELGTTVSSPTFSGVKLALGPMPVDLLSTMDLVVISPGVPLSLPEVVAARLAGVPVWAEVELAYRFLGPGRLLGITGTNGKSTTTALCGQMLRSAKWDVFVGGNLGSPLSEASLAPSALDAYVVELSSFQLEGIETFHPNAAAILNLTPDHVDRYRSQIEYGAAKARIFLNQEATDSAVLNADDPAVTALAKGIRSALYGFSTRTEEPAGCFAGFVRPVADGFELNDGRSIVSFTIKNRALRGAHNVQNAMAAALLSDIVGVSPEAIQRGLDEYPGLAHRLELVRELNGVEWINDSKATNVDSAVVALRALPPAIWLIAGGRGKGAPYAPLVETAVGRVKGVLTIGEDAAKITAAFQNHLPVYGCETLGSAVHKAAGLAMEGDVVLLAPACASYDQFTNFEARGDTFKKLVRGLA